MDIQEIIKIKQLPEIVSALEEISNKVKDEVSVALSMECNEETVKEVKNKRAELNKQFKALEDRRKEVKNAIMQKYNDFECIYKEKISSIYNDADTELKEKIDEVESKIKEEKELEIKEFAKEHIIDKHLENILNYENFSLNVTKSVSMKSLKEQILGFIENVEKDIKLIEMEEFKDEILVEYKQTLDFMGAKIKVIERHKELEKIKEENATIQQVVEEEKQVVEMVVEEIKTPILVNEDEDEEQEVTFTVNTSLAKLKKLKEFMIKEGIKYE